MDGITIFLCCTQVTKPEVGRVSKSRELRDMLAQCMCVHPTVAIVTAYTYRAIL